MGQVFVLRYLISLKCERNQDGIAQLKKYIWLWSAGAAANESWGFAILSSTSCAKFSVAICIESASRRLIHSPAAALLPRSPLIGNDWNSSNDLVINHDLFINAIYWPRIGVYHLIPYAKAPNLTRIITSIALKSIWLIATAMQLL